MLRRIALILALFANISVLACIANRASHDNPILPGTAEKFWANAALSGIREPIDTSGGRYFYAEHGYTFDSLSEAPAADVRAIFPTVIATLNARTSSDPNDFHRIGYVAWKALPAAQQTIDSLIAKIDQAEAARFAASPSDSYAMAWGANVSFWAPRFELHLAHAKLYWATLSFEFLFLSLCIWWTAWPFLRRLRTWRYALHFGLLPILFVSPIYFGYSTYVTGPYRIGPTALSDSFEPGVLYPQLVRYIPAIPYDLAIIHHFPKFLEPISLPYAGYFGPGTTETGPLNYNPSLTVCVLGGLAIAATITLAAWLYKLGKPKPRQGFPVVITGTP